MKHSTNTAEQFVAIMALLVIIVALAGLGMVFVSNETLIPPAFTDISVDHPQYEEIQELFYSGVIAGCGDELYCPDDMLTREEVSVIILRLEYGAEYEVPVATGNVLADMTDTSHWGTKWAEAAYLDELIMPCDWEDGQPLFCPNDPLDRALAAYLIVNTID